MTKSTLQQQLESLSAARYPLHMPGHKRRVPPAPGLGCYAWDLTEIDGADDLHDADGILADAMEAVLAAVYVDGGYEAARGVIRVLFQEEERLTAWRGQDDKSALQEYTQANGLDLPAYEIVAQSGPDHDRRFTAQVSVQGRAVATGEGNSKKAAEQAAAKAALKACRGEA